MNQYCFPLAVGESHVVLTVSGDPGRCNTFWKDVYRSPADILSVTKVFGLDKISVRKCDRVRFSSMVSGVPVQLGHQVWYGKNRLSFVAPETLVPCKLLGYLSSVYPDLVFVSEYVSLMDGGYGLVPCRLQGIMAWKGGHRPVNLEAPDVFGDVLLDERFFSEPELKVTTDWLSTDSAFAEAVSSFRTFTAQRQLVMDKERKFYKDSFRVHGLSPGLVDTLYVFERLDAFYKTLDSVYKYLVPEKS